MRASVRRRPLIVLVLSVLAAAWPAADASAATGSSKPALSAPVIREAFTPLPCEGKQGDRTRLQEEGCTEQQVLNTDGEINSIARAIFARLRPVRAQRRFIAAEQAWLAFRRADCLSVSDVFEGGSESAVLDGTCSIERNEQRLVQLRKFKQELSGTG